jgi:hypothetical protein
MDSSVRSPAFRSFLLLLFIPSRPIRLSSRMAERIKLTLPASQKKTPPLSFPASLSPGRAVHPHLTLASGSSDSNGREIDNPRRPTETEPICDPSVAVGAASAVVERSDLDVNVRAGGTAVGRAAPTRGRRGGVFEWRTAVRARPFLGNDKTDFCTGEGCVSYERRRNCYVS